MVTSSPRWWNCWVSFLCKLMSWHVASPTSHKNTSVLKFGVNAAQENRYQAMDFYMIYKMRGVREMLTEEICGKGLGSAGWRIWKVKSCVSMIWNHSKVAQRQACKYKRHLVLELPRATLLSTAPAIMSYMAIKRSLSVIIMAINSHFGQQMKFLQEIRSNSMLQ